MEKYAVTVESVELIVACLSRHSHRIPCCDADQLLGFWRRCDLPVSKEAGVQMDSEYIHRSRYSRVERGGTLTVSRLALAVGTLTGSGIFHLIPMVSALSTYADLHRRPLGIQHSTSGYLP